MDIQKSVNDAIERTIEQNEEQIKQIECSIEHEKESIESIQVRVDRKSREIDDLSLEILNLKTYLKKQE